MYEAASMFETATPENPFAGVNVAHSAPWSSGGRLNLGVYCRDCIRLTNECGVSGITVRPSMLPWGKVPIEDQNQSVRELGKHYQQEANPGVLYSGTAAMTAEASLELVRHDLEWVHAFMLMPDQDPNWLPSSGKEPERIVAHQMQHVRNVCELAKSGNRQVTYYMSQLLYGFSPTPAQFNEVVADYPETLTSSKNADGVESIRDGALYLNGRTGIGYDGDILEVYNAPADYVITGLGMVFPRLVTGTFQLCTIARKTDNLDYAARCLSLARQAAEFAAGGARLDKGKGLSQRYRYAMVVMGHEEYEGEFGDEEPLPAHQKAHIEHHTRRCARTEEWFDGPAAELIAEAAKYGIAS